MTNESLTLRYLVLKVEIRNNRITWKLLSRHTSDNYSLTLRQAQTLDCFHWFQYKYFLIHSLKLLYMSLEVRACPGVVEEPKLMLCTSFVTCRFRQNSLGYRYIF